MNFFLKWILYFKILLMASQLIHKTKYFKSVNITAFNCNGLKISMDYVLDLVRKSDITFLCEHWLRCHELNTIKTIFQDQDRWCHLKSSVDPLNELKGRPFGGTGFICQRPQGLTYSVLESDSDRISAIKVIKDSYSYWNISSI